MTPFTKIYSVAKPIMIDYKLDEVIKINYEAFTEYMRSLLTVGLPEFVGCLQSLDYRSEIETIDDEPIQVWYFNNDLDVDEISILAKVVVYTWWKSKVQDVIAFQPKLTNKEFKQLGLDQNLKQKSEYMDKLKEDIDRSITNYQLKHLQKLPFFGG